MTDSLLPDGAGGPEDTASEEFDVSDLRVNFSDKEASSEALSFDPIPSGKYKVTITDGSVERCGPESKNPGKPYWNLQLTIQEGEHENRKLFWNVMLFSGALYSLSQLMKCYGHDIEEGEFKVPSLDSLMDGTEFEVYVVKQVDNYKIKQGEWDGKGPKPMKNEVKSASPVGSGAAAPSGTASMMP